MKKINVLLIWVLIFSISLTACSFDGFFPVPSEHASAEPPTEGVLVGGDLRGNLAGRLFQGNNLLSQNEDIDSLDIEYCSYQGENKIVFAGAKHKDMPYWKVVEPYFFCLYDTESEELSIFAQEELYSIVSVDGKSNGEITALAVLRQDGPYSIIEISSEGKVTGIELTTLSQDKTETFAGVWKTDDGYILSSNKGLVKLDSTGKKICSIYESDGNMIKLLRGKDDSLLFFIGDSSGTHIYQVDKHENIRLVYEDNAKYYFAYPLTQDMVLACDSNTLWKIHLETGNKEIFSSAGNGLIANQILTISENKLFVISLSEAFLFEPAGENMVIIKIAGWVPDETAKVSFYAQQQYEHSVWWGAIINYFSKYAEDVYIDYIVYTGKSGLASLKSDLESGYFPDMLDTTFSPPGIFNNYLIDMYPEFESRTGISTDQLFDSVLSTLEDDGALYEIAPAFKISTMFGRSSAFQNVINTPLPPAAQENTRESWTWSNYISMANGEYSGIMLGSTTREEFLSCALIFIWDNFIDYTSASCSFDSDNFISLLEYISHISNDETTAAEYNVWGELQEGLRLFSVMPPVANPLTYIQSARISMSDDVQFTGFPDISGSSFGMYPILKLGICKQINPEKQGNCWKLIKFILSDDACVSAFLQNSICVDRNIFAQGFKEAISLQNATQTQTRLKIKDQIIEVENDIVESDSEEIVWDMLERVNQECYFDPEIYSIIHNYIEECASGAISPEEAAKAVQNEVSLYLAALNAIPPIVYDRIK